MFDVVIEYMLWSSLIDFVSKFAAVLTGVSSVVVAVVGVVFAWRASKTIAGISLSQDYRKYEVNTLLQITKTAREVRSTYRALKQYDVVLRRGATQPNIRTEVFEKRLEQINGWRLAKDNVTVELETLLSINPDIQGVLSAWSVVDEIDDIEEKVEEYKDLNGSYAKYDEAHKNLMESIRLHLSVKVSGVDEEEAHPQ